jgi:hypothetical protein
MSSYMIFILSQSASHIKHPPRVFLSQEIQKRNIPQRIFFLR